ncbi:MAG: hypothetical protein NVSMB39_1630 [Candidatus Saccharimonadales bacterium]
MGLGSGLALAAPNPVLSGNGSPAPFVCVAVPIFSGAPSSSDCPAGEERIDNSPGSGGAIVFYLKEILKLVNGLIGGIIVLVLVIAGFQYIASAGDPTRIKDAKKRITNAITALILYMLMFAILNFLVPGGIL